MSLIALSNLINYVAKEIQKIDSLRPHVDTYTTHEKCDVVRNEEIDIALIHDESWKLTSTKIYLKLLLTKPWSRSKRKRG